MRRKHDWMLNPWLWWLLATVVIVSCLLIGQASSQSLDEPPEGMRPGLLVEPEMAARAVTSIEQAPGWRRIPISQWAGLIAAKHNTSWWTWHVLNQGSVGSCASESKDGGIMMVRERMGLPRVVFNPYGTYGRVNGGTDSGSTLSANLSFAKNYGCFPESVWPRSKGWLAEPSKEAYEAAKQYRITDYYRIPNGDWEAFGSSLLQGYVVYWGYSGHAIVGVDLLTESTFRYLNSWGRWGSGTPYNAIGYGFGTANKSRIMWAYGAYAFETVVHEKGPQ